MLRILKTLVKLFVAYATVINLATALEVNNATQAELEALKGIGPVKAKAIVDERNAHGVFKDSADLDARVKGIGEKTANKLQAEGLTINGKTQAISYTKTTKSSTTAKVEKEKKDKSKAIIVPKDETAEGTTSKSTITLKDKIDSMKAKESKKDIGFSKEVKEPKTKDSKKEKKQESESKKDKKNSKAIPAKADDKPVVAAPM